MDGDSNGVTISKDNSGSIIVTFPYDPHLVAKVKTIKGRRWHKDKKYWSLPDTDGTLEKILKTFEGEKIQLDPALQSAPPSSALQGTVPCI